jgi:hypothetical protein
MTKPLSPTQLQILAFAAEHLARLSKGLQQRLQTL